MKELSFLDKYDKQQALSCMSYMMGMKENSAWKYNLAIIQRYILENSNGDMPIDVTFLKKEFYELIPKGVADEVQANLCIDQCITEDRSYSVYALMSEGEQYAIRRMDMIARKYEVNDKLMRIGRVMLDISDIICERFGYGRYELGELCNEYFIFPNNKELKNNPLLFSDRDILKILKGYNLDDKSLEIMVYEKDKPFSDLSIYKNQLSGPLEWYPLYKTQTGYLVLSPYALLLCAHSFFFKSLVNNVGKENFEDAYGRICLEEIAIKLDNCEELQGIKQYSDVKNMVYRLDIDKYASFTFVTNIPDRIELDKMFETERVTDELSSRIIECLINNESQIKSISNVSKVLNIIVFCGPKVFGSFCSTIAAIGLVFSVDQLGWIVELLNKGLYNLYWFLEDKRKIRFAPINNDFEIFGFYYKHEMTFYVDDDIAIPTGLTISGNPLLYDIYKFLWEKDEHVEYICSKLETVKHLADFADEVPFYINSLSKNDGSYLLVKLRDADMLLFYSFNKYAQISAQIAKSIGMWLFIIEEKFNIHVLRCPVTIFINLTENGTFNFSHFKRNELRIDISLSDINNLNIDEYYIVKGLCEVFMNKRLAGRNFTMDHLKQVFLETGGHFLFAESQGSIAVIDDGLKECMTISKRFNNVVLTNIQEHFNWSPKGVKYNIQDSKKIVKDIITYLNQLLRPLLEKLSKRGELIKLLELHHGQLFWLALTNSRYIYYKRVYDYIGIHETKQHTFEQGYQETNALCKWIIEQIVLGQPFNENKLESVDEIYYAFSIAHQLEVFSTFMDILNNTHDDNDGIEILENGRIAKLSAIDDINKYMIDFSREQFYEQERLIKMGIHVPDFEIDIKDKTFERAFVAEYGISYSDYKNIITKSIDLVNEENVVIANFELQTFIDYVFNNGIGTDKYQPFKEHFMLYGELAQQIGRDKKFNFSDTYATRHNRKLELATRPWIIYDGHVLYSYKSIYRSHIVLYERIRNGRLSCSSKEMTTFESKVNDKKGKAFNEAVFVFLSKELPNSDIKKEVKIGKNEVLVNEDKNIGDFDLLLKNDENKVIVGIELKDFIECRTPYEFLCAIKTYRYKLIHVYERCEWLDKEKMQLKKIYPSMDEAYRIKMIFMTHHKSSHKYMENMEHGVVEMSLLEIIENPSILFE